MRRLPAPARPAGLLLLVAALSRSLPSYAERPNLEPPKPVSTLDVPYPTGGSGDEHVLLELTINAMGRVTFVFVLRGREPFASAATSAAKGWTFEAARSDGMAVSARIRVDLAFHPERDAPTPSAPENAPPAPLPSSPAASSGKTVLAAQGRPEEVRVLGIKTEPTVVRLSEAVAREIPGALGDPLRAIDALPGMTPITSGVPYFYVRGAPPTSNGYFIDGVRVPLLFHSSLGPSVIHPGLIDHVDFYPSASPAQYGGFAGGIIAGATREPAARPHGEGNVRLFDAGALLESPFAEGRGNALVAGRYGFPWLVLGLVSPNQKMGYWDYQTRATWKFGERDEVGLFAFGSHDYLAHVEPPTDSVVEDLSADFHRLDARYDHDLGGGSRVRVASTAGWSSVGASPLYVDDWMVATRLEADFRIDGAFRLRTGAQGQFDLYSLSTSAATIAASGVPASASPPPRNATAGAYADTVWRPAERVEVVSGARFDVFASSRSAATGSVPAAEPRISARIGLTPFLDWLSAFGLAHQYPALRVGVAPGDTLSVPGFSAGSVRLQTSAQGSQGVELRLPADIVVTANVFGSVTHGMTDLTAACSSSSTGTGALGLATMNAPIVYTCRDHAVDGEAYGVELWARRSLTKNIAGWLSYTISRSTREAHYSNNGVDNVVKVVSEYDRTHVLSAIAAYDLGARWRAGARFVFYTGSPYSAMSGGNPVPPINAFRYPDFYRADVRLEKRWILGEESHLSVVFEVQNVTLTREANSLACESMSNPATRSMPDKCNVAFNGPITIPSVGLEGAF